MKRAWRALWGSLSSGTYHIVGATALALLLAAARPAAAVQGLLEAVMEISVNAPSGGETIVVLRGSAGEVWLQAGDLARLHLRVPRGPGLEVEGHQYYSLATIAGARLDIDEQRQHVSLTVPGAAFEPTRLHAPGLAAASLTQAAPGAFLNYQLSGQRINGDATGGALAELGVFDAPGVLTNSLIERTAEGVSAGVRLDTTFTHDYPTTLETLTLGDSINNPGNWGNAVRFAGVHFGTNFAIRPDLITTPLLTAGGTAVVPSTVDVFVNGQRISSQSVPPGPFVIDRLPAVTGAGNLRLVVRDALGQEQIITQPFYSGASLLAAGLSDYSIDVGTARENYALASFDYTGALASANYRRGLTDALTLEAHAELQSHDAHAVGIDLAVRTGEWGVLSATLASGGSDGQSGLLSGIGLEHRGRFLSLMLSESYATDGFRQLGDSAAGLLPFRQRTLAQAGLNLSSSGSVSLAWVRQSYQTSAPLQIVNLSYNVSVARLGWLALTVSHTTGAQSYTSAYLNYTVAFGERRSLSTNAIASHGPGQPPSELLTTVAQNAPVGPGNGWRLSAATSGDYDADVQRNGAAIDVELESARNQGLSGQRGLLKGALTLLDGDLSAVRAVPGSFAVVDVAGVAGIPVYLDNQEVARTDTEGRAILYNLHAYEPNRISVSPEDLPLDTHIASDRMVLQPPYRSGVVARFPIEHVRGGTFRLVTPAGTPVPAGALVRFNGGTFHVALDGLTYVDTLDHGTTGEASWGDMQCKFRVGPPPPEDPQPDMGTILCQSTDNATTGAR